MIRFSVPVLLFIPMFVWASETSEKHTLHAAIYYDGNACRIFTIDIPENTTLFQIQTQFVQAYLERFGKNNVKPLPEGSTIYMNIGSTNISEKDMSKPFAALTVEQKAAFLSGAGRSSCDIFVDTPNPK